MSVVVKQEPKDDELHPTPISDSRMEVDSPEILESDIPNHKDVENKTNGSTTIPVIKTEKEEKVSEKGDQDPNDPDPVIHEIPVFLAKSLSQKLFLFQYPVRPCTMPYNSSSVVSAKFKPTQKQIEMELALDTSSKNFNRSKAEQIAVNIDGKSSKKLAVEDNEAEIKYPSGMMDRQILTSSKALDNSNRYAVGILSDQELHITPVEGVLTIRTGLDHLDHADKTKRDQAKAEENLDADIDSDNAGDDTPGDLKPVTVRFAKSGGDSEKSKKAREKSYEFQQQKAREEQWVDLQFHDIKSPLWLEESQKLFCKHMDAEIQNLDSGLKTYLDTIK